MEQKENKSIEELAKAFLLSKTKEDLKESTLARYTFITERHIIPYFKGKIISKLTNEEINDFIKYKHTNGSLKGKALSPKAIKDITGVLMQIIKNHCRFKVEIKKPGNTQTEITVFTESEYNKLKSYLSIGTDSRKLGIMLAMITGIRIGELCALKWENIDLETGVIHINNTIQRVKNIDTQAKSKTKIIIDTPKSAMSVRTIPLPLFLQDKLSKFKANPNTYILTNTKKYIEPRTYQRQFKAYLSDCDIKYNNFHTLRHTFATMAISKGVDIKTLSVLLGHSDVSFTMKIYVHPNLEHKRNQIEKIAVGF